MSNFIEGDYDEIVKWLDTKEFPEDFDGVFHMPIFNSHGVYANASFEPELFDSNGINYGLFSINRDHKACGCDYAGSDGYVVWFASPSKIDFDPNFHEKNWWEVTF